MKPGSKGKVVFCCPVYREPTKPFLDAMERAIHPVIEAGWQEGFLWEIDCPYISAARATLLRRALDAKADVIVFLDYDLSFDDDALLKLIETPGEVISGNYRFKQDEEQYMGRLFEQDDGKPIVREDGCVKAEWIPAGFLKITTGAVDRIIKAHPELCYGPAYSPTVDLFNHGVHNGVWWGEDYAFSRRWNALGGEIWVIPDLNLTHHAFQKEGGFKPYPGNFHEYLLAQPGGSKWQ